MTPKINTWTPDEDNYIKKWHGFCPLSALALSIGKSKISTSKRIVHLKKTKQMPKGYQYRKIIPNKFRFWTDVEHESLIKLWPTHSVRELCTLFARGPGTINIRAKALDLKPHPSTKCLNVITYTSPNDGEVYPVTIMRTGYYYKLCTTTSGGSLAHRHEMTKLLGRPLERYDIIHHKDGNKQNNHSSNLELCNNCSHSFKYTELFGRALKAELFIKAQGLWDTYIRERP